VNIQTKKINREPISSFRFTKETKAYLTKLAEVDDRSKTNVLEVLVKAEARKKGLIKDKALV
jgi:replication-associated recombination protein RarA